MKVYQAIAAVSADMAKQGISKDGTNEQQKYKFRGIDAVFNALAPSLVAHGLVILPRVMTRSVSERETKSGGVLFYSVLEVEFDFVAVEDGSKHVVRMIGEAMDSGDKSSNKAMSAAYKYAAFQAFCIPTEGDNDADATTHEVRAVALSESELADFKLALREADDEESLLKIGDGIAGSKASDKQKAELSAEYSKRRKALKQPVTA